MKKLCFIASALFITVILSAQSRADTTAPFKRLPTVPSFKLLQTDSATVLTKDILKKNRPVLVILFNPECEHCKHETEEIIKHIDELRKVQIIMAAIAQYGKMKEFYEAYNLKE